MGVHVSKRHNYCSSDDTNQKLLALILMTLSSPPRTWPPFQCERQPILSGTGRTSFLTTPATAIYLKIWVFLTSRYITRAAFLCTSSPITTLLRASQTPRSVQICSSRRVSTQRRRNADGACARQALDERWYPPETRCEIRCGTR